jgi:arylsulfatase A-like enzyme
MKLLIYSIRVIIVLFSTTLAFSCDNSQVNLAQKDFNIVLITIDTLRADHLSCYGYSRRTSPNIDKIAEQGKVFANAIAPSSWTAPSMVSLFTSVYPINHGVIHGIAPRFNPRKQQIFSKKLTTLTEIINSNGYTTFGVASNIHLQKKFGFARGFDYFKWLSGSPAPAVNESVYLWETEIKNADKFFLWVHYFDPHAPYIPRTPWVVQYKSPTSTQGLSTFRKSFPQLKKLIPQLKNDPQLLSNLVALYDSEINYVDFHLGKLIKKFELNKNTLLIITSDHGEEFLEHDQLGHGNNLHQETTAIPLIIKLPYNSNRKTVERHVNLIDIMPTILDMINVNAPGQTLGKTVWERKGFLLWLREIVSRNEPRDFNFLELDKKFSRKSILTPEWKYIYNFEDDEEKLYNITSDPLELNNLITKESEEAEWLKEQLFQWLSIAKKYPPQEQNIKLSLEEEKKLRELGYMQ